MTSNEPLSPTSFPEFFKALWDYDPFPWQADFASRICEGKVPDYVTVPTGSGKTACLDAAVFALAVQASKPPEERTAGRRIFFIVNRRIIVDEAFERAKNHLVPALADPQKYVLEREARKGESKRLDEAGQARAISILQAVADQLRALSGQNDPLACVELRGGIYRDRAWAKSLTQPMIICSTVDQAGSRLLFRGYGVSPEARPVHAALVAHDSLLLIDEAHIVQPFLQTLQWVQKYRAHSPSGSEVVNTLPFSAVRMTATPPKDVPADARLDLSEADKEHPVLRKRLTTSKLASLIHVPGAKGKGWIEKLAAALQEQASAIITKHSPKSLAIMVNRVATAREVFSLIRKKHPNASASLQLGRMRPLDRDEVTSELQAVLKTGHIQEANSTNDAAVPLQIVVSTQCLEVGADLDFDALVTECASLDALRQRFGRLNRGGREDITARASILFPEESAKETPPDPIYGIAISRTWSWLQAQSTSLAIDFGLQSMTDQIGIARNHDEEAFNALLTPRADAPLLLPAYLDCWAQTNPGPAADPDVSLFLHGPQRDMADVQVCWRSDLPQDVALWAETTALCPPTSLECLPVPLLLMRQWLSDGTGLKDMSGDAPTSTALNDKQSGTGQKIIALIWRGVDDSEFAQPHLLRPGDTLILKAQDGGWESLGHVPDKAAAKIDLAEIGAFKMKRRAVVRFHPEVFPTPGPASTQLLKWAAAREGEDDFCEWKVDEIRETLRDAAEETATLDAQLSSRLRYLAGSNQRNLNKEAYPDSSGIVLSRRDLIDQEKEAAFLPDDGADNPLLDSPQPQDLDEHTARVSALASTYATLLGLKKYHADIVNAAQLHDIGKADRRFQAMLLGSTVAAAMARSKMLAKSATITESRETRERRRMLATLPKYFRHEMLSVSLAESDSAKTLLPNLENRRALVLHLIASHHGLARPFALPVDDPEPPATKIEIQGTIVSLTGEDRLQSPSHALDSGIAERFWMLTRLHGWWGLALLETVLRLADQVVSAQNQNLNAP